MDDADFFYDAIGPGFLVSKFTAIVLAGGNSSRMGGDKALLPWAGKTVLEHQLATLRATGAHEVLISARKGGDYGWAATPIVRDDGERCGPLGGICAALRWVDTPLLLALAIDMPAMTPEFLRALIAETEPTRGVVIEREGFYEPLAAVYPAESFPIAAAQIGRGDFALQTYVRELVTRDFMKVLPLLAKDRPLFANFNHPTCPEES